MVGFRAVEASPETNWFQPLWDQHPYSVLLGEGFGGWSSYRCMGALVSAGALGLAREIGERWQGGLAEAGKNEPSVPQSN